MANNGFEQIGMRVIEDTDSIKWLLIEILTVAYMNVLLCHTQDFTVVRLKLFKRGECNC